MNGVHRNSKTDLSGMRRLLGLLAAFVLATATPVFGSPPTGRIAPATAGTTPAVEPPASTDSVSDDSDPAASPIRRVTTIGASMTDGFGVSFWRAGDDRPIRETTDLAGVLRAATDEGLVISNLGTGQFFLNPEGIGTLVVDRVLKRKPDLVVGLDYLFWFVYGTIGPEAKPMRTPAQRMVMLERGLELLERLVDAGVPLVIGDIPDMSAAGGGIMLRSQVPKEETRIAANDRISEWASKHPEVRLLSLDRIHGLLDGDGPLETAGSRIPAAERTHLLQPDRLHPTVGGLSIVAAELLAFLSEDPELGERMPASDIDYSSLLEKVTGRRQLRPRRPSPDDGAPAETVGVESEA